MNDRTEELARRVRNALGEFDDQNMPVVELVRDMAACLRKYDTVPKPEAQAAGVLSGLRRYYFDGEGVDDTAEFVRLDEAEAALSAPTSHDAQHEAVTEHEGEFGLPPLPASAVYWRQRAEFWREQAVSLGWREKRDAENGEAQQPAVVGDGACLDCTFNPGCCDVHDPEETHRVMAALFAADPHLWHPTTPSTLEALHYDDLCRLRVLAEAAIAALAPAATPTYGPKPAVAGEWRATVDRIVPAMDAVPEKDDERCCEWAVWNDRERIRRELIALTSAATPGLHPVTADLVARFSAALAEKLAAAERKYGYSDGWASPEWMDECRQKLVEHVAKGDPRDVAAYCAFLWHHGESTAQKEGNGNG